MYLCTYRFFELVFFFSLPQYRQMYNNNMYERVLLYAKQENEDVFTPLHVVPPTVQGLIRAVSAKYQIDSVDIRYVS